MSISVKIEPSHHDYQIPSQTQQSTSSLDQQVSRIPQDTNNFEDAYKHGIKLFADRELGPAIFSFSYALHLEPGNRDALYMRSLAHRQMRDHQSALKDLESIIRQIDHTKDLCPFEFDVIKETVSLYMKVKNYVSAISRLLIGLRQNPRSIDFLLLSAKLYIELKHPILARAEINKILTINPNHIGALSLAQTLVLNEVETAAPDVEIENSDQNVRPVARAPSCKIQ